MVGACLHRRWNPVVVDETNHQTLHTTSTDLVAANKYLVANAWSVNHAYRHTLLYTELAEGIIPLLLNYTLEVGSAADAVDAMHTWSRRMPSYIKLSGSLRLRSDPLTRRQIIVAGGVPHTPRLSLHLSLLLRFLRDAKR